ncbi:hypothetical protein HPP92_025930, partial [Vanilla planifolia]
RGAVAGWRVGAGPPFADAVWVDAGLARPSNRDRFGRRLVADGTQPGGRRGGGAAAGK